jgi:hypothetical protein
MMIVLSSVFGAFADCDRGIVDQARRKGRSRLKDLLT